MLTFDLKLPALVLLTHLKLVCTDAIPETGGSALKPIIMVFELGEERYRAYEEVRWTSETMTQFRSLSSSSRRRRKPGGSMLDIVSLSIARTAPCSDVN